jgi:hypothetical protein
MCNPLPQYWPPSLSFLSQVTSQIRSSQPPSSTGSADDKGDVAERLGVSSATLYRYLPAARSSMETAR